MNLLELSICSIGNVLQIFIGEITSRFYCILGYPVLQELLFLMVATYESDIRISCEKICELKSKYTRKYPVNKSVQLEQKLGKFPQTSPHERTFAINFSVKLGPYLVIVSFSSTARIPAIW